MKIEDVLMRLKKSPEPSHRVTLYEHLITYIKQEHSNVLDSETANSILHIISVDIVTETKPLSVMALYILSWLLSSFWNGSLAFECAASTHAMVGALVDYLDDSRQEYWNITLFLLGEQWAPELFQRNNVERILTVTATLLRDTYSSPRFDESNKLCDIRSLALKVIINLSQKGFSSMAYSCVLGWMPSVFRCMMAHIRSPTISDNGISSELHLYIMLLCRISNVRDLVHLSSIEEITIDLELLRDYIKKVSGPHDLSALRLLWCRFVRIISFRCPSLDSDLGLPVNVVSAACSICSSRKPQFPASSGEFVDPLQVEDVQCKECRSQSFERLLHLLIPKNSIGLLAAPINSFYRNGVCGFYEATICIQYLAQLLVSKFPQSLLNSKYLFKFFHKSFESVLYKGQSLPQLASAQHKVLLALCSSDRIAMAKESGKTLRLLMRSVCLTTDAVDGGVLSSMLLDLQRRGRHIPPTEGGQTPHLTTSIIIDDATDESKKKTDDTHTLTNSIDWLIYQAKTLENSTSMVSELACAHVIVGAYCTSSLLARSHLLLALPHAPEAPLSSDIESDCLFSLCNNCGHYLDYSDKHASVCSFCSDSLRNDELSYSLSEDYMLCYGLFSQRGASPPETAYESALPPEHYILSSLSRVSAAYKSLGQLSRKLAAVDGVLTSSSDKAEQVQEAAGNANIVQLWKDIEGAARALLRTWQRGINALGRLHIRTLNAEHYRDEEREEADNTSAVKSPLTGGHSNKLYHLSQAFNTQPSQLSGGVSSTQRHILSEKLEKAGGDVGGVAKSPPASPPVLFTFDGSQSYMVAGVDFDSASTTPNALKDNLEQVANIIVEIWSSFWSHSAGASLHTLREVFVESFFWILHRLSGFRAEGVRYIDLPADLQNESHEPEKLERLTMMSLALRLAVSHCRLNDIPPISTLPIIRTAPASGNPQTSLRLLEWAVHRSMRGITGSNSLCELIEWLARDVQAGCVVNPVFIEFLKTKRGSGSLNEPKIQVLLRSCRFIPTDVMLSGSHLRTDDRSVMRFYASLCREAVMLCAELVGDLSFSNDLNNQYLNEADGLSQETIYDMIGNLELLLNVPFAMISSGRSGLRCFFEPARAPSDTLQRGRNVLLDEAKRFQIQWGSIFSYWLSLVHVAHRYDMPLHPSTSLSQSESLSKKRRYATSLPQSLTSPPSKKMKSSIQSHTSPVPTYSACDGVAVKNLSADLGAFSAFSPASSSSGRASSFAIFSKNVPNSYIECGGLVLSNYSSTAFTSICIKDLAASMRLMMSTATVLGQRETANDLWASNEYVESIGQKLCHLFVAIVAGWCDALREGLRGGVLVQQQDGDDNTCSEVMKKNLFSSIGTILNVVQCTLSANAASSVVEYTSSLGRFLGAAIHSDDAFSTVVYVSNKFESPSSSALRDSAFVPSMNGNAIVLIVRMLFDVTLDVLASSTPVSLSDSHSHHAEDLGPVGCDDIYRSTTQTAIFYATQLWIPSLFTVVAHFVVGTGRDDTVSTAITESARVFILRMILIIEQSASSLDAGLLEIDREGLMKSCEWLWVTGCGMSEWPPGAPVPFQDDGPSDGDSKFKSNGGMISVKESSVNLDNAFARLEEEASTFSSSSKSPKRVAFSVKARTLSAGESKQSPVVNEGTSASLSEAAVTAAAITTTAATTAAAAITTTAATTPDATAAVATADIITATAVTTDVIEHHVENLQRDKRSALIDRDSILGALAAVDKSVRRLVEDLGRRSMPLATVPNNDGSVETTVEAADVGERSLSYTAATSLLTCALQAVHTLNGILLNEIQKG